MRKFISIVMLLMTLNLFSQNNTDTNIRQIEFSGIVFQINDVLLWHVGMGVKFSSKKDNWYNNVSVSISKRDFSKKTGTISSFTTLDIGKNYQINRNRFFLSIGSNVGIFLSDWIAPSIGYSSKNYGLSIIPRLEIGFNMKKTIITAGVHLPVGFGFYKLYNKGSLELPEGDGFWSKYRFSGAGTPYIRVIINNLS